jgi:hypothetical protein
VRKSVEFEEKKIIALMLTWAGRIFKRPIWACDAIAWTRLRTVEALKG